MAVSSVGPGTVVPHSLLHARAPHRNSRDAQLISKYRDYEWLQTWEHWDIFCLSEGTWIIFGVAAISVGYPTLPKGTGSHLSSVWFLAISLVFLNGCFSPRVPPRAKRLDSFTLKLRTFPKIPSCLFPGICFPSLLAYKASDSCTEPGVSFPQ